jgi:hypothetical protein
MNRFVVSDPYGSEIEVGMIINSNIESENTIVDDLRQL